MSLQPGRSHAAPDQPAMHWHTPGETHTPCRVCMLQPSGQIGSEQRAPFQPGKHVHCWMSGGPTAKGVGIGVAPAVGVGVGSRSAASGSEQPVHPLPCAALSSASFGTYGSLHGGGGGVLTFG